ncbi:amidohydrolase [Maribacter litopenaei]|uniref:Amidohydrolase n=1 Tax=Maribacter litopenaei TaxID=2976127 RepID=A0ABY5YBX5_9FLAO|nr:amidohydrolase [Maribacter litopenaei]UWX56543.1 amidohydrolase [Maribacter litopenaei]
MVYEFPSDGPTIAFRCELDALPINEENQFEHRSKNHGVSHKCGHDGHMTIVAGLAPWIQEQNFKKGKIVLLFQPAEETGQGAAKILADKRFRSLNIDHIYALHNIPGVPLQTIIAPTMGFSAEVQSFALYLTGKESHASEPENGINPAMPIGDAIRYFEALNVQQPNDPNFKILTPIYAKIGDTSYGISPAKGELHYTIRTWTPETMESLRKEIESICSQISKTYSINYSLDWFEYFPASINDSSGIMLVKKIALKKQYKLLEKTTPFSFGEDFGWFSKAFKATMFGIGAGVDSPSLHHADYDFPDDLISTGMEMFTSLILELLAE